MNELIKWIEAVSHVMIMTSDEVKRTLQRADTQGFLKWDPYKTT